MKYGFIKLSRSENTRELLKRPKSFALLALIALRARRSGDLNVHELGIGEALVGDCEAIGLTQQEYRTAKNFLERLGLATFRGTNRGTVAKLIDCTIFDINLLPDNELFNRQATNRYPPGNKRATTNKNEQKDKKYKNDKKLEKYEMFKNKFLTKAAMPQPTYEDTLLYR
jgi:hypothetical protein